MSSNQQPIDPKRVSALLTHAARQLDDNTLAALKRARDVAMERQALSQPVFALSTGYFTHWLSTHSTRQWMVASMLVMAVIIGFTGYWHHEKEYDISQTDIAILTDDMPLEVFVDHS